MCGKKSLALLVLLLLSSLVYSLTPEEKIIVNELLQTNEKLENRLIERNQQLADRDKQLTELSALLGIIKTENLNLQNENQTMHNLLQIRERLEQEQKNYLIGLEIHRWTATGLLGLSLGYNFWQSLSR